MTFILFINTTDFTSFLKRFWTFPHKLHCTYHCILCYYFSIAFRWPAITAFSLLLHFHALPTSLRLTNNNMRRRLRSASTSTLVVPPTRHSTIGDRAFPAAASRVWNSLPSSITLSTSLSAFRRRLKTKLFSRCFGLDSVWNFCSMFYSYCILFYCKVFLQS